MPTPVTDDMSWSSAGLARGEAVRQWRDWAARTIAPIDVCVFDESDFAARWSSHGVGQLRLLRLEAPAQRVVHNGNGAGKATPSIQLVYARHGALKTRMGGRRFTVRPGEFVLLDNTRFYQMEMDSAHEALDLMMPLGWLDRYLPDPGALLGRPVSAREGWGAPLGSLLETMAEGIDATPLPRPMIAEQVGTLLTLATGFHEPAAESRHRGQLARQILRRIETDFADPDLSPEALAAELGISKRYLQQLLAGSGTSFVQELTATRLDRASDMLTDPRGRALTVGEIAFRCGFLDPGYFARAFRKRFGVTPQRVASGIALGAWGALIMSFFGSVFVALVMFWQWHLTGLPLAAPFAVFAAIGLAAVYVIRLPGEGIAPSKRAERAIMWSTIGEGVGLFLAAESTINLHRTEWLLPAMALVVGLHFLPIARADRFTPFYLLGGSLILAAAIGFAAPARAGGELAGLMAALGLWIAAILAARRDWRVKQAR